MSAEARENIGAAHRGKVLPPENFPHGREHHNFHTGEYAGTAKGKYVKDHLFLRRHFGHEKKNGVCEDCGAPNEEIVTKAGWTKSSLQFSYRGTPGKSSRSREDYELLCPLCHAGRDEERRTTAA